MEAEIKKLIDRYPLPWTRAHTLTGEPVLLDANRKPISVLALPSHPFLADAFAQVIADSVSAYAPHVAG